MKAIESASVQTNIVPVATFITERVKWSMEKATGKAATK
jgi:hypothetical protein